MAAGIRPQARDLSLLRALGERRLLDRAQIEQIAGFSSVSRVNVRLALLRKSGFIIRYFTGTSTGSRRAVFALAKKGAVLAGVPFVPFKWKPEAALIGNGFVAHQLALNDARISAGRNGPVTWKTFDGSLTPAVPLIPDAYLQSSSHALFLEVDLGTEQLAVWTRKVALYLKLAASGAYREIVPYPQFGVLVIATDEQRLQSLRRHLAKQTQKLLWFATLEIIKRQGFWSASWLRAQGDLYSPPGG